MKIRMNQDIDSFEEGVLFGLTARQLFFSVASLAAGAGMYLLCRPYLGSILSCYMTALVVAPLALAGFYRLHDMHFFEVLRRFVKSLVAKPLLYQSPRMGEGKKPKKKKGSLFESRFRTKEKLWCWSASVSF